MRCDKLVDRTCDGRRVLSLTLTAALRAWYLLTSNNRGEKHRIRMIKSVEWYFSHSGCPNAVAISLRRR